LLHGHIVLAISFDGKDTGFFSRVCIHRKGIQKHTPTLQKIFSSLQSHKDTMRWTKYLSNLKESFFLALPENQRLERIWFLAKTDFKKRYYGSFLGLIWALLNPVFRLIIYYVVFTLVFQSREENFILYLYLGLIHYLFFAEAIGGAMKVYKSKAYLLENIQINDLDIYFANVLASLFGFLFNLGIFLLFRLLIVDTAFSYYALYYPLVLITLLVTILAGGLIMSMLWVFFRDIQHVWDLLRMALLWLSGVFYYIDPATSWKTALIAYATPLPGILINARAALLYNTPPNVSLLVYDLVYAIVLLVIGLSVHRRYRRLALEKL